MVKHILLDFKNKNELINMEKTIVEMKNSLKDDQYIGFISPNNNYDFSVRKTDEIEFLDNKTLVICRKNGNKTILNLDLVIGICVIKEWI